MIGLDGSVVNKKNEDDPYGIAVGKKVSTPAEPTPKNNLASRQEEKKPHSQKPQRFNESAQNPASRFPNPRAPQMDSLFDNDDLLNQEEEVEEPQRKPMARQQQKPSTGQLLPGAVNIRKTESNANMRPAARNPGGNQCKQTSLKIKRSLHQRNPRKTPLLYTRPRRPAVVSEKADTEPTTRATSSLKTTLIFPTISVLLDRLSAAPRVPRKL